VEVSADGTTLEEEGEEEASGRSSLNFSLFNC
jgi:hypothetical protein